jgi:hypothetical protein
MVGKQKLHDTTSGDSGLLTLGNNLKVWSDVGGTGSEWLWGTLDFDQAHSAVSSYRESLVIAESWDFHTSFGTGLENGVGGIHGDWLTVDEDVEVVVEGLRWSEEPLRCLNQGLL